MPVQPFQVFANELAQRVDVFHFLHREHVEIHARDPVRRSTYAPRPASRLTNLPLYFRNLKPAGSANVKVVFVSTVDSVAVETSARS
jgi:hypothetical protein